MMMMMMMITSLKNKVLILLYFIHQLSLQLLLHMFRFKWNCFFPSKRSIDITLPRTFSLPDPLPQWPQDETRFRMTILEMVETRLRWCGHVEKRSVDYVVRRVGHQIEGQGFASGVVNLGEIEVFKVTEFELVWSSNVMVEPTKAVAVYKPVGIPDGFQILGHYCQPSHKPLWGFVLVAKQVQDFSCKISNHDKLPALRNPLDYTLVWCTDSGRKKMVTLVDSAYFWLPQPPEGYKALGYLVTNNHEKPDLDEISCVRVDLTDKCEPYRTLFDVGSILPKFPFWVWNLRPCDRGMLGKGVSVGTFFCSSCCWNKGEELPVVCLKNLNPVLPAMPRLDQINALIEHYGPTVFFHPDEVYLPSSVDWFFSNGALLYRKGESKGEAIDSNGSNLPGGGTNDGEFWIDLPSDVIRRESIKHGDLESAKLYVHVKPAFGGTFTDIVMWIFCPFNGPSTLKFGIKSISFNKVGEHIGDWEHFTLRISNFSGELWSIYYSQHSGGKWVDAYDLEYIDGNKAVVYSSKNGHASYFYPGTYIQGSSKLGIGIRNDARRSNLCVDSSVSYEVVAAEYLGDVVKEPQWLQFMRLWGPKIVYDSKTELDKILHALPIRLRSSFGNLLKKLPVELYGEEGPTGPKEKNTWIGDERW